ncbi:MAG: hypothetical protein N2201_01660 [candidate division WOR-3 bacterium]|nr:hypothetical protein [candidate division WOR-3 bacterium]
MGLYYFIGIIETTALIKRATGLFDRGGKRVGDFICYPIDNSEVKSFGHLKGNLTICRLGGQKGMPAGCRGVCPPACPLACRPAYLPDYREGQSSHPKCLVTKDSGMEH